MKDVINFVDTTTRDGSQSNWASGMPIGMMAEVIEDIDHAGYSAIDAPYVPVNFKKYTRDLKEDPWEMVRMYGKTKTKKGIMAEPAVVPFELHNFPRSVVELLYKRLVEMGALQRVQMMGNIYGTGGWSWFLPIIKKLGLELVVAVCYYISPRHTEEYFVEKIKLLVSYDPDRIYIKDAGGLLDVDSIRMLLPIVQKHSNGLPIEIHSHCTTGLADLVYQEALEMGCRTFHVATPPLAEGTAQPSVFNIADNFTQSGYQTNLDLERIKRVSERLYVMGKQANLPTDFGPTRYNVFQRQHKIPGGVISNLIHQLKELKIENRIDEVIEEIVKVCADTGYPHMITPYSQFVCTQAAINVATGERYKMVIDEFIQFALGYFSEDSGYLDMDPNVKDKFLSMPRRKDIETIWRVQEEEQFRSEAEVRKRFDATNLSDEEFLLRYLMNGTVEIEAMNEVIKKRGAIMKFSTLDSPILDLLNNLSNQPKVTSVQVKNLKGSITLKKSVKQK